MTAKRLTLPGQLVVLFDKLYDQHAASPNGNGWHFWQVVLEVGMDDPLFYERLGTIQAACKRLRREVAKTPEDALTARARGEWLSSIDRLYTLTMPNTFSEGREPWGKRASKSDVTQLENMNNFYLLHGPFIEVETDRLAELFTQFEALSKRIATSDLDPRSKDALLTSMEAVRYFLKNLDTMGFEAAWNAAWEIIGTVALHRKDLQESKDENLWEDVKAQSWSAMEVLATFAGAVEGMRLLASAAAEALRIPGAH